MNDESRFEPFDTMVNKIGGVVWCHLKLKIR